MRNHLTTTNVKCVSPVSVCLLPWHLKNLTWKQSTKNIWTWDFHYYILLLDTVHSKVIHGNRDIFLGRDAVMSLNATNKIQFTSVLLERRQKHISNPVQIMPKWSAWLNTSKSIWENVSFFVIWGNQAFKLKERVVTNTSNTVSSISEKFPLVFKHNIKVSIQSICSSFHSHYSWKGQYRRRFCSSWKKKNPAESRAELCHSACVWKDKHSLLKHVVLESCQQLTIRDKRSSSSLQCILTFTQCWGIKIRGGHHESLCWFK